MSEVYVIGGMAMDVEGRSFDAILQHDSNPGSVITCHGGVGRNICENLARLGADVGMISAVGNDDAGRMLLRQLIPLGVDVDNIKVMATAKTAMYLSILDSDGSINVAVAGMEILDHIDSDMIDQSIPQLENAKAIALDTNLPKDTLEYIGRRLGNIVPIFVDTVSTPKAQRIKNISGYFYGIKANRSEASAISGVRIETDDDVRKAAEVLLERGSKLVAITLGEEGAYYNYNGKEGRITPTRLEKVVSTTGAGDAFSAMLIYGFINDMPIEETLQLCVEASTLTICCPTPVDSSISIDKLRKMAGLEEK